MNGVFDNVDLKDFRLMLTIADRQPFTISDVPAVFALQPPAQASINATTH